jgi:hypothetical protein
MEKTTLYLPSELQVALRDAARRTGRSQAEIIREALATYLQQHRRPMPRSLGRGENPDLNGDETEAWLEAHFRPS